MLPLIKSSISASVGFGFFASSATADTIWRDLEKTLFGTSSSIQAFCTGWLPSAERPSIVVTFLPLTVEICVIHERVASPLMCTVQAPHKAIPHPNFVPVLFRVSRSTQRSGMSGLTSTVSDFPFKMKVMAMGPPKADGYPTTIRYWLKIYEIPRNGSRPDDETYGSLMGRRPRRRRDATSCDGPGNSPTILERGLSVRMRLIPPRPREGYAETYDSLNYVWRHRVGLHLYGC